MKKILVCVMEYPPYSSGIGNVALSLVNSFRKKGIECVVCSPTGPDIFVGSRKLILKFGMLGLLYYWYKVSIYFKNKNDLEIAWLHQPIFILSNPFSKSLITVHTTAFGHWRAANIINYSFFLKIYYFISSLIEKYSMNKIDKEIKIIADSPIVCQEISSIKRDAKITYIRNGVDIEEFQPKPDMKNELREQFKIPVDKKVLLWVGRLVQSKMPHTLIMILSILNQKNNNLFLIIVGDGGLLKELKEFSNSLKLKNILFFGYVIQEKLTGLYTCSDYYITTSKYEGQPLTLLEAMASGLPCIVSDLPNLKIVEDANCGIIIDFSDEEKAAQKINDYINKDNSVHVKNARQYAEKHLAWDIIADKYLSEFNNINKLKNDE